MAIKTQQETSVFKTLEKEIPLILSKISNQSSDFLTNEKGLRQALTVGYEFLPVFVRLLISEDKFVEFCIKHKEKLFKSVKSKTKKPKQVTKIIVSKPKIVAVKNTAVTAKKEAVVKKTPKAAAKKTATKK